MSNAEQKLEHLKLVEAVIERMVANSLRMKNWFVCIVQNGIFLNGCRMTANRHIFLNIVTTYGRRMSTQAIGLFCGWWMLMGSVV